MESAKKEKEPPKYPEIGARLSQFIADSGQPNARQFALRAGLTPQLVSHLAAGNSIPSGETLMALATAYKGFDSDWLLTGRVKSQLPPPVPSKHEEAKPGYPTTPGTATPAQVDFVGRVIRDLEQQIADYKAREEWYQEMLKKPLASADAATPAPPRQQITGFRTAAQAATSCKVIALWPPVVELKEAA